MIRLRPLTDGSKAATTGTLSVRSRIIGAVLITADGTNAVTVFLSRTDTNGSKVFELVTKTPINITMPIECDTHDVFYSVAGTGGAAQFYEWIP